jgi:hypothetical protein
MKDYSSELVNYVIEQQADYTNGMITLAEMLQNVTEYTKEIKEEYKLELEDVMSSYKSEVSRMEG